MGDTLKPQVVEWLKNEAIRNEHLRYEKSRDGKLKYSAQERSIFYRRQYMLNRAAEFLTVKE